MRKIHTRCSNSLSDNIFIEADDKSPIHGASHDYTLTLKEENKPDIYNHINFQKGPIKECGFNGFTNESILEVVIDRLRGFQEGKYACRENELALTHLEEAMNWLLYRTERRIKQGVEGTQLGN